MSEPNSTAHHGQKESHSSEHHTTHQKHWYDRRYKLMLLVPLLITLIALIYLGVFYANNNDFIHKDASLSGGTTVTLSGSVDVSTLESGLKAQFPDVYVRTITDLRSGEHIAVLVDSAASPEELKPAIESLLGYELTESNSSFEFTGPALSSSFYKQLIIAIIISFILMSLVIFILFRSFIPSTAVIFAAFADIVITLAVVDIIGIRVSAAGIAAFLMLIGYSVDTDILLTTRVMKKTEGTVNQRIFGAFKTGIIMTITALVAVLPAFFLVTTLPDSFKQIFLILAIGLLADIVNTWLTNASLIKWYAVRRGMH